MKILVLCSRNRQRSLTAERVYNGYHSHEVRSAGTEPGARIRVTEGMIGWADLIVCMEKKHVRRIREKYSEALYGKNVVCLNIPDEFSYMDDDLLELLECDFEPYLK